MLTMIKSVDTAPSADLPDELLKLVKIPPGMPLLFTEDGEFVQEIHLYLLDRVIRRKAAKPSLKTLHAYSEDLSNWWAFLESNDFEWTPIDEELIRDYAFVLQNTISEKTGRPYAAATISRRLSTVLDFYRWASSQGLASCSPGFFEGVHGSQWPVDSMHLAHIINKRRKTSKIIRLVIPDPADRINILSEEQIAAVLDMLGPDLSGNLRKDKRPIRDRLGAEWSFLTGIRLKEVVGLTTRQVLGTVKNAKLDNPAKLFKLRLTITKGNRPRTILVPAHLLKASVRYIETERKAAVELAATRDPQYKEPGELFLNGTDVNAAYAGSPLQGKVLSQHFSDAVIACHLIENISTTRGTITIALFHFHDLRHTFAVKIYSILEKLGKREPWKLIQALLGHRYLSTTIKTYLKHVRIDEASIGDALSKHLLSLARAVR